MEMNKGTCCQRCGSTPANLHGYRILRKMSTLLPPQFCHSVFFILILLLHEGLPTQVPTFTPTDMRRFDNGSTSTHGYYRYLQVDGSSGLLYVGAMEYLYRLQLSDISIVKDSIHLPPDGSSVDKCVQRSKSKDFQCKNHVRSVAVIGDEISVCGSGAYDPRVDTLNTNDLSLKTQGDNGQGRCPFDPSDNSTSIYISSGNPGGMGAFYSGTVTDRDANDPVILRPDMDPASSLLRTEKDRKILDKPDFVNSFDMDEYVYFFFRESAQEAMNCGKAVYSRIARVCKSDLGGASNLEFKWTTYLKARLNCSISGEYPLYFHEMYDIQKVGDIFYGTFSTNNGEGLHGSAVCGFSQQDIDSVFDGDFKEQADSTSLWLAVPPSRMPSQRPGRCIDNSKQIPPDVETFIQERPLMDGAVTHINTDAGMPLYYKSGLLFNNMVLETLSIDGTQYNVFYLTTDWGEVHQVVQWTEGGHATSNLVSVWKPFGDSVTSIKTMKFHNERLYLGTDSAVVQLSVVQCESYSFCTDCVRDPHCGFHDGACTTYDPSSALNSVKGDLNLCGSNVCKKQDQYVNTVRVPGDPIYLHCDSHCPSDSVLWYHGNSQVVIDQVKYFLTQDQGIIIFNVSLSDAGDFYCKSSSTLTELTKHEVRMPGCQDNDASCLWREEFRNWCSEFDSYKKQFNNWVCLKDACLGEETCMPSAISDNCPVSP